MPKEHEPAPGAEETIEIDLRNPLVAAVWAWLWPGAGHIYQRRYAKGVLFMACILGTFFFGLTLGSGPVVYASWKPADRRWQYICQLGVGTPALPALVQRQRVHGGKEPLWNGFMAPPRDVTDNPDRPDELSQLHWTHHSYFELGTLYTMIAGLLNVLVIYDAYAGPVVTSPGKEKEKETERPPPEDQQDT